jgi:hypothetical protein
LHTALELSPFTICPPAPEEKEKKRSNNQTDFQNKSYWKSTQESNFPTQKNGMENQPN